MLWDFLSDERNPIAIQVISPPAYLLRVRTSNATAMMKIRPLTMY